MGQHAAIQSAETLAALRAVVANDDDLAVRCEDRLAKHFLGMKHKLLTSIRPQRLIREILHRTAPGSYCFTIARTRHFDEVLLAEIGSGVEQVVVLGAGYDSRAFRFRDRLAGIPVFEIDHPGTQARKTAILAGLVKETPSNLHYIAVDFTRDRLPTALAAHGFAPERTTLFLWEGVSYYLPQQAVDRVLDFVSDCAAGSSIVFDYAIRDFVDGDTSTYGSKEVAKWLQKIGEPFLFGLHPSETHTFLAVRRLQTVSDFGPKDLETRYLTTKDGRLLGKTLGHVRMVHAKSTGPHHASSKQDPEDTGQ